MSIAVHCPKCQARFEIADDLADQPVCCHQCMHVFQRSAANAVAASIQAGLPDVATAACRNEESNTDFVPTPHARPRSPFPLVPMLVLMIGFLTFSLVISLGFNIWVLLNHDSNVE